MILERSETMKPSENAYNLIYKWECDFKPHTTAYKDCVGIWTIGIGMIDSDYKYTGLHVKKGVKITTAQAYSLFEKLFIGKYVPAVDKWQKKYNWNQNQYDALCSFVYNLGTGSLDTLTNNGKRTKKQIGEYMLLYNKAGGKKVQGLVNRRNDEYKLYIKPVSGEDNTNDDTTEKVSYSGTLRDPEKVWKKGYIQIGDKGDSVKEIQSFLNWYYGNISLRQTMSVILETDGNFGVLTRKVVKAFQEDMGLTADGKWGHKTWKKAKNVKK